MGWLVSMSIPVAPFRHMIGKPNSSFKDGVSASCIEWPIPFPSVVRPDYFSGYADYLYLTCASTLLQWFYSTQAKIRAGGNTEVP